MDLISLLPSSSDDESDTEKEANKGTRKRSQEEISTDINIKDKDSTATFPHLFARSGTVERRGKVRRKGHVKILSWEDANSSNLFSRSIPHRRGHWAGHVKIPILTKCSSPGDLSDTDIALKNLRNKHIDCIKQVLEKLGISGTLVGHDSLHLSLSKYFSLQKSQIEPFVRQLQEMLRHENSTSIFVEPFTISALKSINGAESIKEMVLLNEDQTRSFFCWKVRSNASIRRIVALIDKVLMRYNQPVFYRNAQFHISIASYPGNIIEALANVAGISASHDATNHIQLAKKESRVMPAHSLGPNFDSSCEQGDDDESVSSFEDEVFVVPVSRLHCTLGTERIDVIPLPKV